MIATWVADGQPADHFMLATVPPRASWEHSSVPTLNRGIRALTAATGTGLVDVAAYTAVSLDDAYNWRAPELHVGDGAHYSEAVRDWIAAELVARLRARVQLPR